MIKQRDIYDPRSPDWGVTIPTDSDSPFHKDIRLTFVLLSLELNSGKVYFVIEGLSSKKTYAELQESSRYYYEEHTCPTNFISIPLICYDGDNDPHGLFEFEEAVWQVNNGITKHDNGYEEYIQSIFPQLQRCCL